MNDRRVLRITGNLDAPTMQSKDELIRDVLAAHRSAHHR